MANTPVSPKVKAAGAVGSLVGILVAYAAAVTPETFAFLGKWSQPAYLTVTLGAALFAAYKTTDPLRATDATGTATSGTTSASLPEPPAVEPAPVEAAPEAAPAVEPAQ